jgi:hypothetical protein
MKYKSYMILYVLVLGLPIIFYSPVVWMKYRNLKTDYFLKQFRKKQFIEKKFMMRSDRVNLKEIKDDLRDNGLL